ncbi:MAG: ribosome biogenesis GTPase Der [Bacteroidetes bacterium]|jgi:GTP-binding protein|nr:ribosome biogenesis GTPase Der [Bacteroidota bacterium]
MSRIVAIVGRPNVGKSTLFNRLVGRREAIVDDLSGVTRDRHYGTSEWCDEAFTVIDTGGYVTQSEDQFEAAIRKQVHLAIEEADILLFVVDVTTGITDLDQSLANMLRRHKKPLLVVANKVDHGERLPASSEFYAFGLGEVYPISSQTGSGTGELLDELIKHLPPATEPAPDLPKIALVGRPNVGKSTLLNALLGYERTIVTPIAGTTRDAVHTEYKGFGHHFVLTDTAGLRKKAKVHEDIEFYSVLRTLRVIEESDVILLLLDATQGIEAQDLQIFHLASKHRRGIVILVNKWDLVEKDHKTMKEFEKTIKERLAPFRDVPIVFISATDKQRIFQAVETAMNVHQARQAHIPTRQLNEVMGKVIEDYPPPAWKGKYIRIKYITQLRQVPPTFVFFCNLPQYIRDPYKRYLENKLRDHYKLSGVPVILLFREK